MALLISLPKWPWATQRILLYLWEHWAHSHRKFNKIQPEVAELQLAKWKGVVKSGLAHPLQTSFLRKLWFIVSSPGSSHYTPAKPSRALSFISQFYGMTGVCEVRGKLNKLKNLVGSSDCILQKEKRKCLGIAFLHREDRMGPQKTRTARWPLERKACKILQRKLKCDSCQVTPHEPAFSHQHFRPCDIKKKWKC